MPDNKQDDTWSVRNVHADSRMLIRLLAAETKMPSGDVVSFVIANYLLHLRHACEPGEFHTDNSTRRVRK